MCTRRVALYYSKRLLGESLENLLGNLEDVETLGPWLIESGDIEHLADLSPHLVMVIDEQPDDESAAALTSRILEIYADLPVIHVMLETSTVRVFNSHTIPASSKTLIEAIRNPLGAYNHGGEINENCEEQ